MFPFSQTENEAAEVENDVASSEIEGQNAEVNSPASGDEPKNEKDEVEVQEKGKGDHEEDSSPDDNLSQCSDVDVLDESDSEPLSSSFPVDELNLARSSENGERIQ